MCLLFNFFFPDDDDDDDDDDGPGALRLRCVKGGKGACEASMRACWRHAPPLPYGAAKRLMAVYGQLCAA